MKRSPILIILTYLLLCSSFSSSANLGFLKDGEAGSALSLENSDVLASPNGNFMAGFHPVGYNAFIFAIWFAKSAAPTVVWMANRDQPINGRGSKLSLSRDGNLILLDGGLITVWQSSTSSASSVQLSLLDSGNLVLRTSENQTIWQSFDTVTDTLLPDQSFRKGMNLISLRSQTNYSSGFYKLYFETDNILRLAFDSPEVTSTYWPDPEANSFSVGRYPYNNTRIAVFNRTGYFQSSDMLSFKAADAGTVIPRRLTIDFDGNLRLYSFNEITKYWYVSWQAISKSCMTHGNCGANSQCYYDPYFGRRCRCNQGFTRQDPADWTKGCKKVSSFQEDSQDIDFLVLPFAQSYGYDFVYMSQTTTKACRLRCYNSSDSSNCKAFLVAYNTAAGYFDCWLKNQLLNGYTSPDTNGTLYVKMPKSMISDDNVRVQDGDLNCNTVKSLEINRIYPKRKHNEALMILVWVAAVLGGIEVICICLVLGFLYYRKHNDPNRATHADYISAIRFKRFTYDELKQATNGFKEEIGRGGGGIVYKGKLPDQRIAAIKRLNQANQGEEEFLAEVSILGNLNHMNLIEMWGYCAEGKHRLLVYEYMKLGSLAQNIYSDQALDWKKKFHIALGTAKGLAYLHEECLEWVLHCDIKPQNILLDLNYQPKVSDFGLSKLLNGGVNDSLAFSRIRGTRGYMAPEWVSNQSITSKVDVYSYGIVVLEMITGKNPIGLQATKVEEGADHRGNMLSWLRKKTGGEVKTEAWIEEILGTAVNSQFDVAKIGAMIRVSLKCVEDEKDARPTMSEVVNILQSFDDDKAIYF